MGDSDALEALEGRTGPPTFKELFTAARYRQAALDIIKNLEMEPPKELQVRRKIAEAQRAHRWDRWVRKARPPLERVNRLILDAEQTLTRLLKTFDLSPALRPPDLVVTRDILRGLARPDRPRRGKPGAPALPHAIKALADLGLDESDARALLRAAGIPLSTGRPSRR